MKRDKAIETVKEFPQQFKVCFRRQPYYPLRLWSAQNTQSSYH